MIYDDVLEPSMLRSYAPDGNKGGIIMTSRHQDTATWPNSRSNSIIQVKQLKDGEGLALLVDHIHDDTLLSRQDIRNISEYLGNSARGYPGIEDDKILSADN